MRLMRGEVSADNLRWGPIFSTAADRASLPGAATFYTRSHCGFNRAEAS